jgi:hypothetical protein
MEVLDTSHALACGEPHVCPERDEVRFFNVEARQR